MSLSVEQYRAYRVAQRCVVCGDHAGTKALCQPCAKAENDRQIARRNARRAAQLCTVCKDPTDGKHALCEGCQEYRRVKWVSPAERRAA